MAPYTPPQPATPADRAKRSCNDFEFSNRVVAANVSDDGWRVNNLFYSAMHAVDTYMYTKVPQGQNLSHRDRENAMSADETIPKAVYVAYTRLHTLSNQARYKPHMPIRPEQVKLAEEHHKVICDGMTAIAKLPLPHNPLV